MKLSKILQSVLFALLIIGVFAAMAKNSYGFTFMSTACFGLAILYIGQLVWKLVDDYASLGKDDVFGLMEPFLLAVVLVLFGLRALYIYLATGELLFILVCALLFMVYLSIGTRIFINTKKDNFGLAWNMAFFYSSLLIFLLALASRNIHLQLSSALGVLAMLLALPFLYSVIGQKKYATTGKPVTLIQSIGASKNKAGLLFVFFISSALYTGLTYLSLIPEIENADRPKDYIEQVSNAESGKEEPINGRYQHQKYKEAMDKFLKRHAVK